MGPLLGTLGSMGALKSNVLLVAPVLDLLDKRSWDWCKKDISI